MLFSRPKQVKKCPILGLILGAVFISACSVASYAAEDERPVILTTFTVLADMARQVAGDHLKVESITKVGAEIHGYEPTPGDLRRAANADLILDNGLNLEAWFEKYIANLDVPHVVVSTGIEEIQISEGEYRDTPNPHAWMSPLNAQIYVDNIAAAFSDLDPANRGAYEQNAATYKAKIQEVHDGLMKDLDSLDGSHRALVTCEGAFSYLTRDAGLTEAYLWPVNAEQQVTPKRLADVISFVEERGVPAVFCESTVSDRAMRQVVRETGSAFGGILYVDSLSLPDGPVPSYLDLLRYDVGVIVSGLAGAGP